MGPGITTYLLPAKTYPTNIRATGHGLASGVAKIGAFVGALLLPVLQSQLGIYTTVLILSFTLLGGFVASNLIPRRIEKKQKYQHMTQSKIAYEAS